MRQIVYVQWPVYVPQIVVGALFILIGVMKFQGPSWLRNFARWGYPDGSHIVVGVLEIVGGLGLLFPSLTTYAAAMLLILMAGAVITHVLNEEPRRVVVPLVYLGLVALAGWLRRNVALHRGCPPFDHAPHSSPIHA